MTVDWCNVDKWFGAFSAPCAEKQAHGLVYPFFVYVRQTTWFGMLGVCRMEGKWVGRGIEDREVHNNDNVKEVSRMGKPPMWCIILLVSKDGFPWKSEVGWNRVACKW